ncbi:hypothetical protein J5N97_013593 [Dioscorea zingiberensis]|uniref:DNA2/NAM7 helicase-like C-terminal domain-containing protein n=1 Tax=Dioscorea zingiberensis TaxID=325984 RepID=A0A9D5CSJ1_9LILI|nr:hypothetical protein J5N97_013593 [Dioscorea zingiberensis]
MEHSDNSFIRKLRLPSIYSFQGREKDFIILSCVRSNEHQRLMAGKEQSLENTPAWPFAGWFTKRQKIALRTAIEKLKEELMVLGFISILLGVTQSTISNICVPIRVENTMLPCHIKEKSTLTFDGVPNHCAAKV